MLQMIRKSEIFSYTMGVSYIVMIAYMSYYNHKKEMLRLRDLAYDKRKYL